MNNLQATTAYVGGTEIKQVRKGDRLVLAPGGDKLWYDSNEIPSLDLRFADSKSLVDATTGTNLIDFTRASSGTYVGSDGLIKTATTNLLSWSEDFTNAVWQTTNPGEVTVVPGVADPFGGTNATTLFHDSGAGDTGWLRRVNSGTIGLSYRFSFWIRRRSGSGNFLVVLGDNINQTISGITSEWQRVSVSNTPTSTTLRTYFKVDSAGDQFDVFGAQLEQSSTVGEYVKTTSTINSAPRFDHDPTTGESLGLLVEEQRTNLLLYSTNFDNSYWLQTYITTNAVTGPDGTTTAATYEGTASGAVSVYNSTSATVSESTQYTYSIYLKLGTMSASNYKFAVYDVSSGSFIGEDLVPAVAPTTTNWTRVSYSFTTPVGCTQIRVYPFRNSAVITSSTVHFWGAQLEEGSFPTSYIPTEASTVTRAADVASISGANFSSWYRQDEGTVFVEGAVPVGVSSTRALLSIDDGTNAERIQIRHNGTTARAQLVVDNSTVQFSATFVADSFPPGEYRKLAMAAKANDFAAVTDDTGTIDTGTGAMPTPTQLQIGNGPSNPQPCKPIKRLTYWPARLPNETLSAITQ